MDGIEAYEAMSKLDLSEDERKKISGWARMLTDSFRALEEINTCGIEPLVTVLNLNNILREDTCQRLVSREEILANAPEQYDGYFQVPATLD